ncbi:MAG: histidine kinase, partial [Saprospiraceae bacterium]|nr:histidine kinase [Saprospiraceae bacterium]
MKSKTSKVLAHITGCAAFLVLPILFAPGRGISLSILRNAHTQREMLGYFLLVLFFYLNFLVLIPKLYFKKRYFVFAGAMLVCLIAITFIPPYFIPHQFSKNMPMPPELGQGKLLLFELGHNFFGFLVALFVSMTMSINNKWKQVQEEKLATELSYLKAQINPHFLFNTLNSIYAMAIEKSDHTATAVVKLSGMMRYVITEAHDDYVALEKEIDYLGDYVELQKMRLENTVEVVYEVNGPVSGKQIAPLVLIPFVENAFKYGVN